MDGKVYEDQNPENDWSDWADLVMGYPVAETMLDWAKHLKASDVEKIELYVYDGGGSRYGLLNAQQIEETVELICHSGGTPMESCDAYATGNTVQFVVYTLDGIYTVDNYCGQVLRINGFYYSAQKQWLADWYSQWTECATIPALAVEDLAWAQTLQVEDVARIQVERTFGEDFYADSAQIRRIVELLNQTEGVYRQDGQENDGGYVRFMVKTQNGRTYEVKNNGGLHFSINGFHYDVPSSWLNAWWEEWASADVPPIQTDPPVGPVITYTFQTGQALHTLEKLSAQVSLDSNGRLMIQGTDTWGPLLGQLYQEEVFPNSEWFLPYLPNFSKTCQQVKDLVGQPGQLWICPYDYPTSGIIYFKLFLLYQTEDGPLYLGATKFQTSQKNDDKLLYLYQLDLVTKTADEPHIWAQNLKAEDIAAMTLLVRGETYQLEPGSRQFQKYLAKINQARGTKLDTMENAYGFDVTILVDTTDGKRHIVVNDSGEKLMIDGFYYQVDTDWLYSWWEEWRKS